MNSHLNSAFQALKDFARYHHHLSRSSAMLQLMLKNSQALLAKNILQGWKKASLRGQSHFESRMKRRVWNLLKPRIGRGQARLIYFYRGYLLKKVFRQFKKLRELQQALIDQLTCRTRLNTLRASIREWNQVYQQQAGNLRRAGMRCWLRRLMRQSEREKGFQRKNKLLKLVILAKRFKCFQKRCTRKKHRPKPILLAEPTCKTLQARPRRERMKPLVLQQHISLQANSQPRKPLLIKGGTIPDAEKKPIREQLKASQQRVSQKIQRREEIQGEKLRQVSLQRERQRERQFKERLRSLYAQEVQLRLQEVQVLRTLSFENQTLRQEYIRNSNQEVSSLLEWLKS